MTAGATAKTETVNVPTPELTWVRGRENQKLSSRTAIGSRSVTLAFLRVAAP
jgi:hypothetical protein